MASNITILHCPHGFIYSRPSFLLPIFSRSNILPLACFARSDVTVQELIKRWTGELSEEVTTFFEQARRVSSWDTALRGNIASVEALAGDLARLYAVQAEVQRDCALIEEHQRDLAEDLDNIERKLSAEFAELQRAGQVR